MDVAFRHVAGNMLHLLEANRSAFAIAGAVQHMGNKSDLFSQVGPNLFLALAMQPLLAQVSYAGLDGAAFSYYRADDGEAKALFTDSHKRWYTQAVDPATGHLVGSAAALTPGCAPVGDDAGVVSTAATVDDVVGPAATGVGLKDVYYAIGDQAGGVLATAYRPVLGPGQNNGDDASAQAEEMGFFSVVECATSAINAPKVGQLRAVGRGGKYRVACTNLDVSGVHVGFRLVLHTPFDAEMIRAACISVLIFVGVLLVAAALICVLALRALRRAAESKAELKTELVRQKEALRQAERKSMNKSNAFASASHDIRSALAAIAGLVEVCRPEAQAHPNITDNLNQMGVCTNKLFGILNSILDTSKVESGKMQLEEAEFNMADVLEESVDMANIMGMSKGIEVIWDPCDLSVLKCANVTGDCKRLKQILDNLLGNALKFTREGHVILRAWANQPIARSCMSAPSRFACGERGGCHFLACLFGARDGGDEHDTFNVAQNDPNLVEFYFEVVDTGIGIPREQWESVFENYVQVNDGHGGTGLGLGIVQSFVRLMGGEISIKEKEPGEIGTCFGFNVLLKTSESQEPQDIEEGPSHTVNDSSLRASVFQEANNFKGVHCVLYVQGVETRRIMQTWMESIGMKVWLVPQADFITSTVEKVQSIRSEEICQEMVKCARIKQQTPCKVVFLADLKTALDDLRRFMELGCDLVLRKPMHGSRLYAILRILRELQASEAQNSSQVGPEVAGTNHQPEISRIVLQDVHTDATTEVAAQEQKTEDDKPLAGMHVLLAEDTLVLQIIQKKMLSQLGATVTLAVDGSEAVKFYKQALEQASVPKEDTMQLPYHVIFMDCQMPVIDGYEATKLIRKEESRYGIHTPIIALTAHTMEEDLQKAIDAGMDLHLTKPLERKRLWRGARSGAPDAFDAVL
ncbi:hypothetical protein PR202_gb16440 [Eleusine coracana subsp. coracana]|uniref:Probable histidine kinase 2 n=1 Tax=Eleusine coracana subsp. coracana TaxID=191504 RepID=A0AAV5F1H6_ELECO|nr:hypothetical protein PR202_gb16440 [Eleusine coracana subsp. coracana]